MGTNKRKKKKPSKAIVITALVNTVMRKATRLTTPISLSLLLIGTLRAISTIRPSIFSPKYALTLRNTYLSVLLKYKALK